jgi:hypothetical protein
MEHLGTKELETKRLILRRFTLNDAEALNILIRFFLKMLA